MKRLFLMFFLVSLLTPYTASAYTVTVNLRFFDTQSDRFDGSFLEDSTDEEDNPLKYAKVYLMDQDGCNDYDPGCDPNASPDDLLGVAYTNPSGKAYFYNIGGAEDIYVLFKYENKIGRVVTSTGSTVNSVSATRWDFGQDITLDFNATCVDSFIGLCNDIWNANMHPVEQGMANILAAMAEVDYRTSTSQLEANGHDNLIKGYYGGPSGYCTSGQGQSWGYDNFCVVTTAADDNHVVAHEIGHIVHRRQMGVSGALANCPSYDWIGSPAGYEKCATSEGWANFFAGAVYWPRTATTPLYRMAGRELENDTETGNGNLMRCAAFYLNPKDQEANAARFFWDLYDSTTAGDDGNDDETYSFIALTTVWDDFFDTYPQWAGNRGRAESGNNGRNLYDYSYWLTNGNFPQVTAELNQNCVQGQQQ